MDDVEDREVDVTNTEGPSPTFSMPEAKRYTRAEVAKHDGKDINTKLWIIVKDVVYDVTSYVDKHPGGKDPIMERGGQDATDDFANHPFRAKAMINRYKIGKIVEEEKHYSAKGNRKGVTSASPEQNRRSCTNVVTCGLLG